MHRRSLLLGLGAALAAPAIVKAESLMKIAAIRSSVPVIGVMTRTVMLPMASSLAAGQLFFINNNSDGLIKVVEYGHPTIPVDILPPDSFVSWPVHMTYE